MVRKPLKDWLSAVYQMPVVDNFNNNSTKVEQSISFDLSHQPISVRFENGFITFDFNFKVLYRCPNGFEGIGFLTTELANKKNHPAGFDLTSTEAEELIEYQNTTEMVISKNLRAVIKIEKNHVREPIKQINLEE